jgi:hypothetical protein
MDLGKQVTTGHLLLETRTCRVCGEEKNLVDDYYLSRKDPTLASSYSYECKECTIKRTVEYNKENSSSVKSQYLKRNYGLTFEEFDAMLSSQDNACAICGTKEPSKTRGRDKRFHVDHSPETGEVRGLLCKSCNIALGEVKENIHTLKSMIEYLA